MLNETNDRRTTQHIMRSRNAFKRHLGKIGRIERLLARVYLVLDARRGEEERELIADIREEMKL